jgi:hypothetical protein
MFWVRFVTAVPKAFDGSRSARNRCRLESRNVSNGLLPFGWPFLRDARSYTSGAVLRKREQGVGFFRENAHFGLIYVTAGPCAAMNEFEYLNMNLNDKSKGLKGFHAILEKPQEEERQLKSSDQGRLFKSPSKD